MLGVAERGFAGASPRACAPATSSTAVGGDAGRELGGARRGLRRRGSRRAACALDAASARSRRAATARASRDARSSRCPRSATSRRSAWCPRTCWSSASSRTRRPTQAGLARGRPDPRASTARRSARFASFAETVRTSGGRPLEIAYRARRRGSRRSRSRPRSANVDVGLGVKEPRYLVGIARARREPARRASALDRERNPLVALPRAVGMTVEVTQSFLRGLGKIVTGEVSRNQIAGPIGIAEIAGNAMQQGWETYLSILVRDQHQPRHPEPAADPDPRRRSGAALRDRGRCGAGRSRCARARSCSRSASPC